jgi:hypothetical protein
MSKYTTTSNRQTTDADTGAAHGFEISNSKFEFVSDFELRISDLSRRRRYRGFSFTEIMFAVIILGVGFIMVAAIFPVAIQQAKTTTEETTAAAISRGAATYIGSVLSDGGTSTTPASVSTTNCPPLRVLVNVAGGQVSIPIVQQPQTIAGSTAVAMWSATKQNIVLPEDPRYGFIYLYRRNVDGLTAGDETDPSKWSPYVQLYIFPVQSRISAIFEDSDFLRGNLMARPNTLPPQPMSATPPVKATVTDSTYGPNTAQVDLISFKPDGKLNEKAAVEGAYVIVSNDNNVNTQGRVTGQMFKLGSQRLDLDTTGNTWELQPGNDFNPDPGPNSVYDKPPPGDDILQIVDMDVYIIGRSKNTGGQFDGPALPISAYTTFVKVN